MPSFIYAANSGSNSVSVLDPATNAIVSTVAVGVRPTGLAVNPAGTRVYVTNTTDGSVSVIATATSTVITTVPGFPWACGIIADPSAPRVYVANMSDYTVSVLDTNTNAIVGTPIRVGGSPARLALGPGGARLYVTNLGSNNVSVIDTAGAAVIATVPTGTGPNQIKINPAGTRLYVTNSQSATVTVIDTAANTVTATVPVGKRPEGIAVNPAGTQVYVADMDENSVAVIDTATNTVTARIAVGVRPEAVMFSRDGTRAYVTNFEDGTLSVIDPANRTILATTAIGGYPYDLAPDPVPAPLGAPAVTGVSPASGGTGGGTKVTLTGTNLAGVSAVTFGPGNSATPTGCTATTLTVTTPAEPVGTVDVRVTTPAGTSAISAAARYSFQVAAPTVTAVSPVTGPLTAGTRVTITGTNLAAPTSVLFGGRAATIVSGNAATLDVTTPAAAAGAVDVQVVTAGGTSAAVAGGRFTYAVPAPPAPPTVTRMQTAGGAATGGNPVTVIGTNLAGATLIDFGTGRTAPVTSSTATTCTATAPPGPSGKYPVKVTTPGGTSPISDNGWYAYY